MGRMRKTEGCERGCQGTEQEMRKAEGTQELRREWQSEIKEG